VGKVVIGKSSDIGKSIFIFEGFLEDVVGWRR